MDLAGEGRKGGLSCLQLEAPAQLAISVTDPPCMVLVFVPMTLKQSHTPALTQRRHRINQSPAGKMGI